MGKQTWNDARCAQLCESVEAGLSAEQTACVIGGVTRSAVIGRAHRMGLSWPAKRGFSAARAAKPRVPPKPRVEKRRPRSRRSHVPLERTPIPRVKCEPVPLLELQPGQCRFEVSGQDDPAQFLFCANPVAGEGISWCSDHCRVVHGEKWQSIGDVARRIVKGLK